MFQRRRWVSKVASTLIAIPAAVTVARPLEEPPRAARSVHLQFILPSEAKSGVVEVYNEVTVRKSTPGSYFEVCGFAGGYFGIQERTDKKVRIFSVWDTGKSTDDKNAVEQEERVTTVFSGDGVRVERFGGEGTGGHSDFDCGWMVGHTYRFDLRATVKTKSTEYDAWFCDPESGKGWRHIATFAAPDGGKTMTGLYSFIEDFRRDKISATQVRCAEFGNAWVKANVDGPWLQLLNARFTASGAAWEAKSTIDAGVVGERFYLQTGGDTKTVNELKSLITRPLAPDSQPPHTPATQPTR